MKRATLSQAIARLKPASSRAPVKPPSAFTLPVPKLKLGLAAWRRA